MILRFWSVQAIWVCLIWISLNEISAQQTIRFSHTSGWYPSAILLDIHKEKNQGDIYYTLNGDKPDTLNGTKWRFPIVLTSTPKHIGLLSEIPTTPLQGERFYVWKKPQKKSPQANIIRAQLFANGVPVGDEIVGFYMIGDEASRENSRFPVVSLITDSIHLFDYESGIYVPGLQHDINHQSEDHGNYYGSGSEWERPAYMLFFESDNDLVLEQLIDIRIHGGYTRRFPVKTLRLYAKNSYGTGTFDHDIFENQHRQEFKRLLLRNAGQEFNKSYLGDVLMAAVASGSGMEYQLYRPSVVYINGEYWGIHNIRERIDKYFLANFHGLHTERVDLIKFDNGFELEEGDWNAFNAMWDNISNHDMSIPAVFDEFCEMVDIDNLIDHYVYKIFFGVYDWGSTNIRIWRPKITGGKFRWIFFDNDGGFRDHEFDGFMHALEPNGPDWPNPAWSTMMFRNLMQNRTFRNNFLHRMALHLNTTFCEDNLLQAIDDLHVLYEPEMERHIARWSYPSSMNSWRKHLDVFREFATKRNAAVRMQMNHHFGFKYLYTCLPDQTDSTDTVIPGWIFPNPVSTSDLSIYGAFSNNAEVLVRMFDLQGREVHTFNPVLPKGNRVQLILPKLTAGVYLIRLQQGKHYMSKKILIAGAD